MLYVWYLAWAIFVMWAVILVYDQRVLDIDHSYMLYRISLTKPELGLPHVLILAPFVVPLNVTVLTVTFCTPASSRSLPRLPMLRNNKRYY